MPNIACAPERVTAPEKANAAVFLRGSDAKIGNLEDVESLCRILGGVVHNMSNLLTVILGYNSLLRSELSPFESLSQHSSRIDEAGLRAKDLTRQLLAFCRRQLLRPQPADLNGILATSRSRIEDMLGDDIQLELDLDPDLEEIEVDADQIVYVLFCVIRNSIEAMPNGGSIRIETCGFAAGPECLELDELPFQDGALIRISDTGVGMDRDIAERMFEPFFTTKPAGKGLGMGLAAVHGIITQCQGEILIESSRQEGCAVTLLLPRVPGCGMRPSQG